MLGVLHINIEEKFHADKKYILKKTFQNVFRSLGSEALIEVLNGSLDGLALFEQTGA